LGYKILNQTAKRVQGRSKTEIKKPDPELRSGYASLNKIENGRSSQYPDNW